MKLEAIEIVEDRTASSRCDEGFLRLARLVLRNRYTDGSRSDDYPCDVVSRTNADAVVAVLYQREGGDVRVLLRESPRAPIWLRRTKQFEHPDSRPYDSIREVVAGLIEPGDGGDATGLARRAALEAEEEAGVHAAPDDFAPIGNETFASPGISDEKIYFAAGELPLESAHPPRGDGSVMEECSELVVLDLREAIEACRSGAIPDMKTEVALLRLADHVGYLPQLGCYVEDLPADLRARHARLGVAGASGARER